jgi:Protein of unknown function DUF115
LNSVWHDNLKALELRTDPESQRLADHLSRLGPSPDLGMRDRQGRILPGLVHQGRPRSLVSTFDPVKEASRWAEDWTGGSAVVFGGAGRNAAEALNDFRLAFWVEPRMEVWQSLFTCEDWTTWISRDEWIPVAGPAPEFQALVLERYHPLWDGSFRTLDWKGATSGQEALWDPYRKGVLEALDALASDASTQARFGERWYRNALVNLKRLKASSVPGCRGAVVVVAGAGPTLGDALENPVHLRWLEGRAGSGDRLFSTDTALPALTSRGIVPDLVLCLDGQLPTVHHFVPARPPGVPLVADLSSLPFLDRIGMPVVRYLSGHPFGAIVRRFFPDLPLLDGSLGNVSGLALAAARSMGAGRVETWGVDFAYREGQAYARGTYVYALAQKNASRLTPLESRLSASCYGAKGLERTRDQRGRAWDTTPLLRDYRDRWKTPPRDAEVVLAHGDASLRWEAFADHWRGCLNALPFPAMGSRVPFHAFVRSLPRDQRQDWLALWPLALAMSRHGGNSPEDLPRIVRSRALAVLDSC